MSYHLRGLHICRRLKLCSKSQKILYRASSTTSNISIRGDGYEVKRQLLVLECLLDALSDQNFYHAITVENLAIVPRALLGG